jgi:hypothetical protein
MSGEYISVSNGKRPVSNVKKRAKMFAVCAWTQIAVTLHSDVAMGTKRTSVRQWSCTGANHVGSDQNLYFIPPAVGTSRLCQRRIFIWLEKRFG